MFKLKDLANQMGKRFLITGGNSGLGYEAALQLSKVGGEVIIACRCEDKAKEAVNKIKKEFHSAHISYMILDTSDFNSVREFSKEFHQKYERLDVLLCNAGIMENDTSTKNKDGFELHWATNYLGHFLLTSLMMDVLKKSKDPRIVNQSSLYHNKTKMPVTDIKSYILTDDKEKGLTTYGDTKYAQILETDYLAREFEKRRLNVRIFTAHPGWTSTNLGNTFTFKIPSALFAMSTEQGVLGLLMCATSPIVKNGHFYGPKSKHGDPQEIEPTVPINQEMEDELFRVSEELTKETFCF